MLSAEAALAVNSSVVRRILTRLGFAPMSCRRDKTGYGYAVASLLLVDMVWTRIPDGTSDEGSGA